MEVNIKDLLYIYEHEVSRNTKNKNKVYNFERYKMLNIINIKRLIESGNFHIDRYNIFYIYEPKLRIIMSLDIGNRIVDHYIAKHILIPKLDKYLDIRNIASRKNMGMSYGIKLVKKYLELNKKYDKLYALKLDISKYFYNIDHEILKSMLYDILDYEEYKLIASFIDSTDREYVNIEINNIKNQLLTQTKNKKQIKEILEIPFYNYGKGLTIGNVCSQILSIFALSRIDFYIINSLHCKYMIRYCDDIVIFNHDKKVLEEVYKKIELELEKYKLKLNKKKCSIVNVKDGFIFCGNYIKLDNKKTIIKRSSASRNKIRKNIIKREKMYKKGIISYRKYFCSINSYKSTVK